MEVGQGPKNWGCSAKGKRKKNLKITTQWLSPTTCFFIPIFAKNVYFIQEMKG
jgi:hypothetical protein